MSLGNCIVRVVGDTAQYCQYSVWLCQSAFVFSQLLLLCFTFLPRRNSAIISCLNYHPARDVFIKLVWNSKMRPSAPHLWHDFLSPNYQIVLKIKAAVNRLQSFRTANKTTKAMESHLSSSWKKLLLERKKQTVKLLGLKCGRPRHKWIE